ncbi:ABC transporter substrate-binding protein [Natronomonas amylolytica]|uniref:ABC transporter substrate-binding protein n=1 Tax=Natronomonas amylolytica TaxID=3108498 RepID=UPI00300A5601
MSDGKRGPNRQDVGASMATRIDRRTVLKGLGASGAVSLAGCTNPLGQGSNEALKIGFVVPTSGPFASAGETMTQSLEMATSRVEEQVAGRPVETFVRDSGTEAGTAVPKTNELIQSEDIDILIGGFSSSVILALQDVAKREELLYLPVGGGATSITGEKCNKYTFAAHSNGYQFAGAPVAAYENGLFDSLYVLAGDYSAGRATTNAVEQLLRDERDADVRGTSTFPLGNQDFSSQISDARESNADVCYFISAASDSIRFLQQARGAGLHNEMDLFFVFAGNLLANAVGSEALDGVYAGTHFYWEAEGSKEFSTAFREEYGQLPDWFTAPAFDASMEALTAVDTVGSASPDDLIQHLEGREFNWTRPATWRACDHRAIQPFYLLEGKSPSEKESESDYYNVLDSMGGEQIMRSCQDNNCDM